MKVLAIVCLILVVLLPNVISQGTNANVSILIGSNSGNAFYHYPRIPTSCPISGDAQISNYFFDGQKCEICQDHCKCTSYLGCNTCDDGYGKIYVAHSDSSNALNSATCYSCGADTEYIKDCCFQVVTKGTYTMDATNKRVHNFITHSTAAKRAISCFEGYGSHTDSKGQKIYNTKVMRAGSVCHHISHCYSYTPYGACKVCREGYFLNSDMHCQQCGYISKGNYVNQVHGRCMKCNGPADCQECLPGYYIPTLVYNNETPNTNVNVPDLESQPSYCQQCKTNCLCTESNECTGCLSTVGYHYNSSDKECRECNNRSSGCIKCNSDLVCTECSKGYQLIGNSCVQCSSTCNIDQCIKFKEGDVEKVGCSAQGCINGYVFNEVTKECFPCDNQVKEYARCTLNPKQEKGKAPVDMIPTQCKQDIRTDATTSHDQWSVLFNRLPVVNTHFLIKQGDAQVCINNSFNCKKMDTNIPATKESKCTECYTEFGYHLTTTKECILCQVDFCLSHTLKKDLCSCTACITGRDQTQDYRGAGGDSASNTLFNYAVTTGGTCQQCNVGCVSCDASGACKDNCQLGYRSEGSECQVCQALHCKSCSAKAETCTACFDGYRLWTTSEATTGDSESSNTPQCERCDPGCSACQSDVKVCTRCMSGYYLLDNICRQNKMHCVTHNDDGTCQHCEYGYRNVQGICLKCRHTTATSQGYFNCPDGCSSQSRYIRDGDILTEEYYNTRMAQKYQPINSQIIGFVATAFIALVAVLL